MELDNKTISFIIIGLIIFIGLLFFQSSVSISVIDPLSFENTTLDVNVTDSNSNNFYLDVAKGSINGYKIVHKFGATQLDTSIHPATQSKNYKTPKNAINLEFLSDSSDDDISGIGARKITIIGLNDSWDEVTQVIETDGITPVSIPIPLTRLYRWFVSESGTYANQTKGSHVGNLKIREAGGGELWSTISNSPFAIGQSQIGVYSCAKGQTAYLLSKNIFIDSTKTADVYFFRRGSINDTTTSYEGTMRIIEREVGVQGGYDLLTIAPKKICECPCDMGFMGEISVGTSEGSFEFELLLIDN